MKGRIVFPIRNAEGVIVAYAGRSLKDDDEDGKYRFPTGFQKQHELYNIDRVASDEETRAAVAENGIIVVEGFTDVLRLAQNGVPNCVALMGSDFAEPQIEMLLNREWNPSQKLTLFLDDNDAGNACKRKMAAALIRRAFVRFADYGAVQDSGRTEPEQFTEEELGWILL